MPASTDSVDKVEYESSNEFQIGNTSDNELRKVAAEEIKEEIECGTHVKTRIWQKFASQKARILLDLLSIIASLRSSRTLPFRFLEA